MLEQSMMKLQGKSFWSGKMVFPKVQYKVMEYMTHKKGYIQVNQIAQDFGMTKAKIRNVLHLMFKKGLLERKLKFIPTTNFSRYVYRRNSIVKHKILMSGMLWK